MSTRLIINADDLGLTRGINTGILELFQAGALSSATLMANGPAFDDAIALARANPALGVGCHIVLTDGLPVAPPSAIPTLLDPAAPSAAPRLRPSLAAFARAAILRQLRPEEIEIEAAAQVTRLLQAGVRPTHLDTHKHTHLFPTVLPSLVRVASRFGIPLLRNPFEPAWSMRLGTGSTLRRLQIRALSAFEPAFRRHVTSAAEQHAPIQTTGGTVGVSATGDLDRTSLADLFTHMPPGTWELVCHPGYNDADLDHVTTRLRQHREVEREALLGIVPAQLAARPDLRLISFADLASPSPPTVTPLQEPSRA